MARSLKKGPFVDQHLMKKVEALNENNKTQKQKRKLRKSSLISNSDYKRIKNLLHN